MFNFKPLTILALLLPVLLLGAENDLSIRIVSYTKEVPLGAPPIVNVEVKNISGHPLTVVYEGHGFIYRAVTKRVDGTPRMAKLRGDMVDCDYRINDLEADQRLAGTTKILPADWKDTFLVPDLQCDARSGELIMYIVARSHGPYGEKDQYGHPIDETKIWSGNLKTEEIRIKIVEPTGIDREAYEEFKHRPDNHPEEILAKYPKSTYAAYLLWRKGRLLFNPYNAADSNAEEDFEAYSRMMADNKDCPKCLKFHKQEIQDGIDSFELLLRTFPDFPFRNEALFGLAQAYFRIGTPEKAVPLLTELMKKFPDSDEAKKAPVYMATLKKHGV